MFGPSVGSEGKAAYECGDVGRVMSWFEAVGADGVVWVGAECGDQGATVPLSA